MPPIEIRNAPSNVTGTIETDPNTRETVFVVTVRNEKKRTNFYMKKMGVGGI